MGLCKIITDAAQLKSAVFIKAFFQNTQNTYFNNIKNINIEANLYHNSN